MRRCGATLALAAAALLCAFCPAEAACEASTECGDAWRAEARCGASMCDFARSCGEGGEGNWYLARYACDFHGDGARAFMVVGVLLWMGLLFVMLGSTADAFFAPTLEQFSRDLGLPPRFAGVTLLALGNGAPDASATVSAISRGGDGYKIALGALTGAGMFVGTAVAGAVMLVGNGAKARGALLRDVSAYGITCIVVMSVFAGGAFGVGHAAALLSLYVLFVLTVLCADVYHRRVVLPKQQTLQAERLLVELEKPGAAEGGTSQELAEMGGRGLGAVLDALSNYDASQGTGAADGWADDFMVLRGDRPPGRAAADDRDADYVRMDADGDWESAIGVEDMRLEDLEALEGEEDERFGGGRPGDLLEEARGECAEAYGAFLALPWHEKALAAAEFPFFLLRKLTIPLTAQEVYSRPCLVLSLFFLPLWLCYYYDLCEVTVGGASAGHGFPVLVLLLIASGGAAVGALRLTRGRGIARMPALSAGLALVGFAVAATWIDVIADSLVSVLQFLGWLCGLPSSVLGLTVLAWGNSVGDLSTNLTMARRGLGNMAITACFAGPIFNVLVGLGAGFLELLAARGARSVAVTLPPSLLVGFLFLVLNCVAVLAVGIVHKGRIPRSFGYAGFALYAAYLAVSVALSFTEG